MTPIELIDRARIKCDPPTDYELAKHLHVHRAELSSWRRREGRYNDEAAAIIAEMTGLSLGVVIAVREMHTDKDPSRRRRWRDRFNSFLNNAGLAYR